MLRSVYLLQQDVAHVVDGEVVAGAALQAAVAAQQELAQEVAVDPEELIQTREHGGHSTGLHLQLLQHAVAEHLVHDVQRPHVMQLRLDQLFERHTHTG